ncbi:MAG: NAD(P)-binding domain-containing protein [Candidatus Zipacnadales bacterium]
MKETIGLVGIGLVGSALAERLLATGFRVIGYDLEAAKCVHLWLRVALDRMAQSSLQPLMCTRKR